MYLNINRINGKQEVMIGYSNSRKDASRLSAAWQLYKAQEELVKMAKQYGVKLTMFHGRGGQLVGEEGPPILLYYLSPYVSCMHKYIDVLDQHHFVYETVEDDFILILAFSFGAERSKCLKFI
jgi:phosphoenolpyruvate carboxylase